MQFTSPPSNTVILPPIDHTTRFFYTIFVSSRDAKNGIPLYVFKDCMMRMKTLPSWTASQELLTSLTIQGKLASEKDEQDNLTKKQ